MFLVEFKKFHKALSFMATHLILTGFSPLNIRCVLMSSCEKAIPHSYTIEKGKP